MTFLDKTPILGLPKKTVSYVPVPLTASERAFYSFLEFMVNEALKDKVSIVSGDTGTDDARSARNQTSMQNRAISLVRLLRDYAISPVLITGGYGIKSSALRVVNEICNEFNRLQHTFN